MECMNIDILMFGLSMAGGMREEPGFIKALVFIGGENEREIFACLVEFGTSNPLLAQQLSYIYRFHLLHVNVLSEPLPLHMEEDLVEWITSNGYREEKKELDDSIMSIKTGESKWIELGENGCIGNYWDLCDGMLSRGIPTTIKTVLAFIAYKECCRDDDFEDCGSGSGYLHASYVAIVPLGKNFCLMAEASTSRLLDNTRNTLMHLLSAKCGDRELDGMFDLVCVNSPADKKQSERQICIREYNRIISSVMLAYDFDYALRSITNIKKDVSKLSIGLVEQPMLVKIISRLKDGRQKTKDKRRKNTR